MVASEDSDTRGVADFERDKEGNGFDGIIASIDIIALPAPSVSPVAAVSVGREKASYIPMKR